MIMNNKTTWSVEIVYTDNSREVFTNVEGTDFVGGFLLLFIKDKNDLKKLSNVSRYTAWVNKDSNLVDAE